MFIIKEKKYLERKKFCIIATRHGSIAFRLPKLHLDNSKNLSFLKAADESAIDRSGLGTPGGVVFAHFFF